MKLYNFPAAPNPTKVRIYLAEKGIDVPLQLVDILKGEHRTPEFTAKNPLGLLPVLELDDGTCFTESLAIIEYFEELNPEPPMFGTSPTERMRVRGLERMCDTGVLIPLARYLHHTVPFFRATRTQDPAVAAHSLATTHATLAHLDQVIGDRPFMAGTTPTVADCSLYAGLLFASNLRRPLNLAPYPNLDRWWTNFGQRPSASA